MVVIERGRRRTRARGNSPRGGEVHAAAAVVGVVVVYPLPGTPDVLRRGSACLHKTPRFEVVEQADQFGPECERELAVDGVLQRGVGA